MSEKGKEVVIYPATRLEGHAKINIYLDDNGDVKDVYFQIIELRGFERFCIGRLAEEMPRIVPRICGVCPWAHHMASAKATDKIFKVNPPPTAVRLRRLGYYASHIYDHFTHIYALGGPDFIVGPDAPPSMRNIVGVIQKLGVEAGKAVLKALAQAHKIMDIIGGKSIHPVTAIPGGIAKPISEKERDEIRPLAKELLDLAKLTLDVFKNMALKNEKFAKLMNSEAYMNVTHYMSIVDDKGYVDIYDGNIKIIDPKGREIANFRPEDYLNHIAEHVESWSYCKFPYLKNIGWKGLVDGEESGMYTVGPLARINVTKGYTTPLAQAAYEEFVEAMGKPCHNVLAFHWARIIETIHECERALELLEDPELTSPNVRTIPSEEPASEGVGAVEAPRGTLIHHYKVDENAVITDVNIVVATTHNHASIAHSVKRAAKHLIKGGEVRGDLLNAVEMAFRAYDPCLACATHNLPSHYPIIINIFNSKGDLIKTLKR